LPLFNIKKINNNSVVIFKRLLILKWQEESKPNPIIFDYALDLAKAKKENSIMIGDSLDDVHRQD
jgi:putative hydrolase of the HAD superfamily